MKLLIVACLIAVCAAQAPPVPMIAESFCGTGEIEFHQAEQTLFGKFGICRDQVKQMEVEGAQYEQTKDAVATLLRYDMTPNHMAYYIRGKEGGLHCITDERNVTSKLPPFFDWVKLAIYEGQRTIREIKYDFWGLTVADVRFELAVALTNPNIPVYYNRKEAEDFVQYSFQMFNTTAPDPSVFKVPDECNRP